MYGQFYRSCSRILSSPPSTPTHHNVSIEDIEIVRSCSVCACTRYEVPLGRSQYHHTVRGCVYHGVPATVAHVAFPDGWPDPHHALGLTEPHVHCALPRASVAAWHGTSPVTRSLEHGCGLLVRSRMAVACPILSDACMSSLGCLSFACTELCTAHPLSLRTLVCRYVISISKLCKHQRLMLLADYCRCC